VYRLKDSDSSLVKFLQSSELTYGLIDRSYSSRSIRVRMCTSMHDSYGRRVAAILHTGSYYSTARYYSSTRYSSIVFIAAPYMYLGTIVLPTRPSPNATVRREPSCCGRRAAGIIAMGITAAAGIEDPPPRGAPSVLLFWPSFSCKTARSKGPYGPDEG
jgi:hypothetical protein